MNDPGFYAAPDFDAALQLGTTFLAYGLRIVDVSGAVRAFTNLRRPQLLRAFSIPISPSRTLTHPETRYESLGALRVSNLVLSDDVSQTDNMEATLAFSRVLPEALVRAGALEGCRFSLVVFDWKTPIGQNGQGRAMLRLRGKLGERTIKGREATWKLRSLAHALRGDILESTSRDSRARWGDPELSFVNPETAISHDGYRFALGEAIAEVDQGDPRRHFRLSGAAGYPDDRFADGLARFSVSIEGATFEAAISILSFEPTTGWFRLASDAPLPLVAGQIARPRVRAPRTLSEWLLYFGDGKFFAGEPGIPTVESANRINTG